MPENGYVDPICEANYISREPGNCPLGHELKFRKKEDIVDSPDPESLKQFKTPRDQQCWNSEINLDTGRSETHTLKIKSVQEVSLATKEIWDAQKCECGAVYGWFKGREASEAEIAAAKAGKIALRTIGAMVMGRNSP
jgi:hypothetical protein